MAHACIAPVWRRLVSIHSSWCHHHTLLCVHVCVSVCVCVCICVRLCARTSSMMLHVSKPRWGWSGKPAKAAFAGRLSSSSIRYGSAYDARHNTRTDGQMRPRRVCKGLVVHSTRGHVACWKTRAQRATERCTHLGYGASAFQWSCRFGPPRPPFASSPEQPASRSRGKRAMHQCWLPPQNAALSRRRWSAARTHWLSRVRHKHTNIARVLLE